MTLTLCGFPLSNYYNKVKLVLLEKGLPFDEELHTFSSLKTDEVRAASPLGKVPFLRTPQGTLCESAVIVEYLEQLAPQPALWPADPFAAAKAREIAHFLELHLELVAREVYGQAFFGAPPTSDAHRERVRKPARRQHRRVRPACALCALCRRRRIHAGRLCRLCPSACGGAMPPQLLAVAVELLDAGEAALHQQAHGCAGCARPPCLPRRRRTGSAGPASARARPGRAAGSGWCRAGTAPR
jgi:glutathione S-transferase